ncbi:MAG: hypothetical protein ABJA37_12705 [Ferruginibacter sp.]
MLRTKATTDNFKSKSDRKSAIALAEKYRGAAIAAKGVFLVRGIALLHRWRIYAGVAFEKRPAQPLNLFRKLNTF